tara:strand:- start:1537 stop:2235 length:699 start_codon:yes stop_codon:yes gene_type:complete
MMKTQHKLCKFENKTLLERQLSEQITQILQAAILARGQASLVVSGGQTPVGLFKLLSQASLDWSKVWITLADERWVPPTDLASNEAMVREHLLQHQAAQAHFIPLWQAGHPSDVIPQLEKSLHAITAYPFDVVVLGMGLDGHTASWFPCSAEIKQLWQQESYVATVQPQTAEHLRMTFTPKALLNAKNKFIHVVGQSKLDVLEQACKEPCVDLMPIRAVLEQEDVCVFWSLS